MNNPNIVNQRMKLKFLDWLKEADGCCEATARHIEKAIIAYEEFTKYADFKTYGPDKAKEFKKWLLNKERKGKPLAIATYYSYIKNLRKFFLWLSWQAGYKSKITPDIVNYLQVSDKDERIATQQAIRKFPPLDYVIKLADSIKIETEIDKRDRALIAFTFLSAMRDTAIATLPIGCFDEENLIVSQNPRQGVKTKFSKFIYTPIYVFDKKLLAYTIEWVAYLKSKGFTSQDPLFPRSKMTQGQDNLSFEEAKEVEPVFWKGAGRIREIFKNRAKEAGLQYYEPHTFRHLAFHVAYKNCKNGGEIKALSQSFGHEYVATSMAIYGNYQPQELAEIIKGMNFTGKPKKTTDEKIDEIFNAIKKNKLDP